MPLRSRRPRGRVITGPVCTHDLRDLLRALPAACACAPRVGGSGAGKSVFVTRRELRVSTNTVHLGPSSLEPLSREAAQDRSPRVERSGTLGPKPIKGKPRTGRRSKPARSFPRRAICGGRSTIPQQDHTPCNKNRPRNGYVNGIAFSTGFAALRRRTGRSAGPYWRAHGAGRNPFFVLNSSTTFATGWCSPST